MEMQSMGVSRSIGLILFIAMGLQLWSTGWVKGATAFERATFPREIVFCMVWPPFDSADE
jgi:hypothetical protein